MWSNNTSSISLRFRMCFTLQTADQTTTHLWLPHPQSEREWLKRATKHITNCWALFLTDSECSLDGPRTSIAFGSSQCDGEISYKHNTCSHAFSRISFSLAIANRQCNALTQRSSISRTSSISIAICKRAGHCVPMIRLMDWLSRYSSRLSLESLSKEIKHSNNSIILKKKLWFRVTSAECIPWTYPHPKWPNRTLPPSN